MKSTFGFFGGCSGQPGLPWMLASAAERCKLKVEDLSRIKGALSLHVVTLNSLTGL